MTSKKVIAILAVAFLMFCPVAVAFSDVNADSNGADEKATILTVKNSNGDALDDIEEVFSINVESEIANVFYLQSFSNVESEKGAVIKDIVIQTGAKNTKDGDTFKEENLTKVSYTFELVLKVIANGKIGKLMDTKDYESGDGITAIKDVIGADYSAGKEITLTGKYAMYMLKNMKGDTYNNKDLGYTLKKSTVDTYMYGNAEGKFSVKDGKVLEIKSNLKENVSQDNEYKYNKDWKDVKANDEGTRKAGTINFNKLDAKMEVKVDNSNKEVKLDMSKLKDSLKTELTKYPGSVYKTEGESKNNAVFDKSTDVSVTPQQIPGLVAEYREGKTMKEVQDAVKGISGGEYSEKVDDYNKVSNEVKDSVGANSDNTWIWIVVAVVVILIIAAIAVWYFKFRTPPAE